MARTKQTARKRPAAEEQTTNVAPPPVPLLSSTTTTSTTTRDLQQHHQDRSTLLQLMGYPIQGVAAATAVSARTVKVVGNNDWTKVIDRLLLHPEEATFKESHDNESIIEFDIDTTDPRWYIDKYPLFLALTNEITPITSQAVEAFIQAYPEIVTQPRSQVLLLTYLNPKLIQQPDITNIIIRHNSYLCQQERTLLFQYMGFSSIRTEMPGRHYEIFPGRGYNVNWENVIELLVSTTTTTTNPILQSKIICPGWDHRSFIFPLEAVLHFKYPPVPLQVIQLLLQQCPEAVLIPDSSALYMACCNQQQDDPRVIQTILQANPTLASSTNYYLTNMGELGLPLHEAIHLPCATDILVELIEAYPPSLISKTARGGAIPLQVAARKHNLPTNVLRILLEQGQRYYNIVEKGIEEEEEDVKRRGQLFVSDPHVDTSAMSQIIFHASNLPWEDEEHGGGVGNVDNDASAWQNLCLCLQTAGTFKMRQEVNSSSALSPSSSLPLVLRDYPLLHAVIEFGQKQVFFDKIFRDNPNDVSRVDRMGRTPLMVAIEMAGKCLTTLHESNQQHHRYWGSIDFYKIVIHKLLDDTQGGTSQLAARTSTRWNNNNINNDAGSLLFPLHQAIHQGIGLSEGLDCIVSAYHEALAIPDPETNLLPCLLAAVGERAKVDTIFGLLMERPNLIVNLISEESESSSSHRPSQSRPSESHYMVVE